MARDPEAIKRAQRKHHATHREKINADSVAKYHANIEAERERRRQWYAANKEVRRKKRAEWRAKNREQRRQLNAKWRRENIEKSRKSSREWQRKNRATNPEQARIKGSLHMQRRRARKLGSPGQYTVDEILELHILQGEKCAACKHKISDKSGPFRFQIDHVMPLAKGGDNSIENIQLLCRTCNHRKSAKHPDEWAKEHGLLFC